ncbi:MAG: DNA alkylation repair protein [Clostridia bacterium]|nr:DNA alkylation repair protein [Clostridia bacterium]
MVDIEKELFELQDIEYREFQCSLMPTVSKDKVIGVRIPYLRKMAKDLHKSPVAEDFMNKLPHKYYEEYNLHGFLIEKINDFDATVKRLDEFLPYVDNWATCDSVSLKVLGKYPERLKSKIYEWLSSEHTYTVRYAIKMLMTHFLDEDFDCRYLDTVCEIKSEEYYIRMMQAWYFATALAKQYDAAIVYIEDSRLDTWVHNKAIQKAIESYRITPEQKVYLRTLKKH